MPSVYETDKQLKTIFEEKHKDFEGKENGILEDLEDDFADNAGQCTSMSSDKVLFCASKGVPKITISKDRVSV